MQPGGIVGILVDTVSGPVGAVLDAALEGLGGSVTRRAARDVYAEVRAAGSVSARRR
jgi:hypothetical protein